MCLGGSAFLAQHDVQLAAGSSPPAVPPRPPDDGDSPALASDHFFTMTRQSRIQPPLVRRWHGVAGLAPGRIILAAAKKPRASP